MGVDGGAGNAISLSEVQTFYGGSNPISMSEYYRNGSLVPGDQVTVQSDTDGTTSQTIGEFGVTVASAFSGSPSTVNNIALGQGGSAVPGYTVTAADAAVFCTGGGSNDSQQPSVTVQVTRSGSVVFGPTKKTGLTGSATTITLSGPVFSGSGLSTPASPTATVQTGDIVGITQYNGESIRFGSISASRRSEQFDVTFTNNNATTITTSSSSTGGAQSYTQSQSRVVKDDQSTANYTLGYPAVNGNTNAPASGTINMNVFNAPGSATP